MDYFPRSRPIVFHSLHLNKVYLHHQKCVYFSFFHSEFKAKNAASEQFSVLPACSSIKVTPLRDRWWIPLNPWDHAPPMSFLHVTNAGKEQRYEYQRPLPHDTDTHTDSQDWGHTDYKAKWKSGMVRSRVTEPQHESESWIREKRKERWN